MQKMSDGSTLPGWRDFERACALAFQGTAVENKFFVDVIFPLSTNPTLFYGIDCKMRRELRSFDKRGIIYVEVSNAAKLLWSYLSQKRITEANFRTAPDLVGNSLIEALEDLKIKSSSMYPAGPIDTHNSYYLVLLWSEVGDYQLFQLPLALPRPLDLHWRYSVTSKKEGAETTRLIGISNDRVLYEWYGESGGQFKYFPQFASALWYSPRFRLEPLPTTVKEGLLAKVKMYFPSLWENTASD